MIHYARAVDHIKHRRFEVEVPAYYHPNMPDHIVNPPKKVVEKLAPGKMVKKGLNGLIVLPMIVDPNQLQRASYSIEIMLDMFSKKVEFSLVQSFDIVEILNALDRYLISIQHDVEAGSKQSIDYARLVIEWRVEVYKHYYRYMKQNPAAAEKLYPNNDPNKNIFSLLSSITGGAEDMKNLDPLHAKAFPPYQVPSSKSTQDSDQNGKAEVMMETSLGLPSNMINRMLDADLEKFDLDDFLGRKR